MPKRFLASAIIGFVCGVGTLIMIDQAPAQGQAQGPGAASLPSDSQLDALLAARDWKALAAALYFSDSAAWVTHRIKWLQARVHEGGGSLLDVLYLRDLWKLGNIVKDDDPNNDTRLAAGLIWLYTYEVIAIDGAKCEDRTAPAHRVEQLTALNPDSAVLAYMKAQSPATKAKYVDYAIAYEQRTAPFRKEDDLLCRDGTDQMQAGIAAGTTHEAPTSPGGVGTTVEVDPPPGYMPKYLPAATYLPLQRQARASMRTTLLRILG